MSILINSSKLSSTSFSLRLLSTSAISNSAYPGKAPQNLNTYLAVIPDYPNSTRLAVRPQHLIDAIEGAKNGWIVQAGATFFDDSPEPKMGGSWLLIREKSVEAARAMLSRDLYATSGVWNMEKASIIRTAIAKLK